MIVLMPGKPYSEKGKWRRQQDGDVAVSCPKCGTSGHLGLNDQRPAESHTVGENGKVIPSMVCPNDECTFHEFVKLHAWTT